MSFRKSLVSAVGVAAIGLSMFAGVAGANNVKDTDTMETSVAISCNIPATVDLVGESVAFNEITDIFNVRSTQTDPGAIGVKVDMGCYWGPWQVSAQTTNFSAGPGKRFSAKHFSLQDANVETYYYDSVDGPRDILEPEANDAYFASSSDQDVILETQENWIFWWQLPDTPAPFVTEASYTGHLDKLPFLPDGTYEATLTVELALD